jgi:hypothetical protein
MIVSVRRSNRQSGESANTRSVVSECDFMRFSST